MLPPKQKAVFDFVSSYQQKHGSSPTLDEISQEFRKAIPTIHQHVKALRKKGYLKPPSINLRSVGTFEPEEEVTEIPLMGLISAGEGIEPVENPEPIKVLKNNLSGEGRHYALKVVGDSMIEDHIKNGDIVIVRFQNVARDGDTVIAIIDQGNEKATIKKFYNLGDKIELRAANSKLKSWPKQFEFGDIEIRGKFVGLIRKG